MAGLLRMYKHGGGIVEVTTRPPDPARFLRTWRERVNRTVKAAELIGAYTLPDPGLDCTSLRQGQVLDFSRAALEAKTTGKIPAVDFTNSSGLTIHGLALKSEPQDKDTKPPYVGVLLSRHSSGAEGHDDAAGKHTFYNLKVTGVWGLAGLYSIGSEVNRLYSPRVDNDYTDGLCAMYLGRRNGHGVQSAARVKLGTEGEDRKTVIGKDPIVPGNDATATNFMCTGLYSESNLRGDGKATIIVAGHSNISFMAPYILSKPGVGELSQRQGLVNLRHKPRRSHILIDTSGSAMDGMLFTGVQALGRVAVALRIDGALSNGIAGLHFQAGECVNTKFVLDVGPVSLTHGAFDVVSLGNVNIDPRARLVGSTFRGRENNLRINTPGVYP